MTSDGRAAEHCQRKTPGVLVGYLAHLFLPLCVLLDELVSPRFASLEQGRSGSDRIVLVISLLWLVVGVGILFPRRRRERFLEVIRKPLLSFYGMAVTLLFCELIVRNVWKKPSYPGVWLPGTKLVSRADPEEEPGVNGIKRFTVNEIGLRGPSIPHRENLYRIVTMGGSTTQCVSLDDSEEWPHLLMEGSNAKQDKHFVWVGNAAMSGHTTVHHLAILRNLPIFDEADLVTFLIGANDLVATVAAAGAPTQRKLENHAAFVISQMVGPPPYPYFKRLRILELGDGIIDAVKRKVSAQELPVYYRQVRAKRAQGSIRPLPDLRIGLEEYTQRVLQLARECKVHRARCLFLTQPTIWRPDLPSTQRQLLWVGWIGPPPHRNPLGDVSLGYISLEDEARAMNAYNSTLLDVCRSSGLECYDLASRVPKDTSAFYDDMHFNEGGARIVAQLLVDYLLSTPPFAQPRTLSTQSKR